MIKKVLLELAVVIICAICIFYPGKLLLQHSQEAVGSPTVVPEKLYSAANMSMAKSASEKLKTGEKVQLIRGEWESVIYEGVSYETNLAAFQAANLAVNGLEKLYKNGDYPIDVKSNYANWYSWNAESYKAVDSIFHTYTVYYWILEYEKYDHTERHTVAMLENGTIYSAKGFTTTDNGVEEFEYELKI